MSDSAPKRPTHVADQIMAVEVFSQVLAATDASQMGEKLTEQLRELTGASIVIVITRGDEPHAHELLHACPTRSKTLFSAADLDLLCQEHSSELLPCRVADFLPNHPLRELLLRSGIESLLRIPLYAASRFVGMLLLLDLPAFERIDEMSRIVTHLSPVLALALRNALAHRRIEQQAEQLDTQTRELEQRVSDRTEQLKAANKELEAFAYSVSHDLLAPLRAIDGFSHILQEDYADKLDDEGKRLFNVVRDNTSRMRQLIDDILNFSRTGRLEMNLFEIDMEKMAHAVFADLEPDVAESKLQWEIGPMPPARGDNAMLRQVFVNLLSNAIKFSRTRETPLIKVGAYVDENDTVYYVKDNGVGFNMHYVDKLFGAFQRLHSADEFEGTGIGLAIVKRIIKRHGGRVWAESKIGESATIYFTLPKE